MEIEEESSFEDFEERSQLSSGKERDRAITISTVHSFGFLNNLC